MLPLDGFRMEWMWCRKWESWAQRKEHLLRSLSSPSVGSFSFGFSINDRTIHHLHRMMVTGLSQWTGIGLVCYLKLEPHIGVDVVWSRNGQNLPMYLCYLCWSVPGICQFCLYNYMRFFLCQFWLPLCCVSMCWFSSWQLCISFFTFES